MVNAQTIITVTQHKYPLHKIALMSQPRIALGRGVRALRWLYRLWIKPKLISNFPKQHRSTHKKVDGEENSTYWGKIAMKKAFVKFKPLNTPIGNQERPTVSKRNMF